MKIAKQSHIIGFTFLVLVLFMDCSVLQAQAVSSWQNLGPSGGIINGLIVNAKQAGTLLAGTSTGEIYKTTDDGQNWFYLNSVGKPVRRMMLDTVYGNNLYVFASHETDPNPQVFVSTNGGQTWSSGYTADFGNIFDSYIIPQNITQMYAISRDGLFRSMNQGASWFPIRSAGDTSELIAMAVNPQDPFHNFYIAYVNNEDRCIIQRTMDGGYYYDFRTILPVNWSVKKLYVADDPAGTVYAVISDGDSVKIMFSQNNGANWSTAYASNTGIGDEYEKYSWLVFPDRKTYVVNLRNKILKSNNGGMDWNEITMNHPSSAPIDFLTRSSGDTSKFYGFNEGLLYKYIQGTSGTLGTIAIIKGLTAGQINKIHYVDDSKIVAQWENNLIFSKNLGLDYEVLGTFSQPYGAFYSETAQSFIWTEEDGRCFTSGDGRTKDTLSRVFSPGTGVITNGFSMNVFFDTVRTLMLVSVYSVDPAQNGVWMSENNGISWSNITGNSGLGIKLVRSLSAYPTLVNDQKRIRILAATENSIHATLQGSISWNNNVFSAPAGTAVQEISSNRNTIMISATNETGSRLYFSRLENSQWNAYDVTSSIETLYTQNGPGQIIHVNSALDGNYLILEHYQLFEPTKRKLYKIGRDVDHPRWVEISENPVDLFLFNSVGLNLSLEDFSTNVYAASNNGIWKLKQIPVITYDTATSAPSAEVLTGESDFSVPYRNSGSAYGYIDSFVLVDPEGNFSFTDPADETEGLFLDIKTETPLELLFHPRSPGIKQAKLTAYLLQEKSNGLDDSVIVMTTTLKGLAQYAQIGTGLKGDTLNMGATMIGTTLTKTFYVKNTGTEILDIYDMYLESAGTSFDLLMDTTEFSLAPGESKPISVSFDAGSKDSLITGNCWIYSSSYNSSLNQPDTLRKITFTARASWMQWVQSDDPVLNQSYTLEVSLSEMKNSTATATLKYWPTGSPASTLKSRALAQVSYPDNHLHLNVSIPSEDITEKGVSFYIEVTDGAQIRRFPENGDKSPVRLAVKIPSPGLNSSSWVTMPGGTSRKDFRMISFPIELDNKSVQQAFTMSNLGELGDKGEWQLYRWDRNQNRFIKATDGNQSFGDINSGKSYLLITRQAKTLNSGPGQTVVPGSAQTLILPGWNMISNPYTYPILWSNVVAENNRSDFHNLVTLSNGRFEYVEDKNLLFFRLEPWKGYLYYSDSAFVMNYPANDATVFSKVINEKQVTPRFAIQAELFSMQNEILGKIEIGEHAEAADSRDAFDKPSLPSLSGDDIRIRLIADDGKTLHTDFRRNSDSGSIWDFEIVHLAQDQSVSLKWNGTDQLPEGYVLAVLNRASGKLEYVTSGEDFRIGGTKSGDVRFRVMAGTKEYIESQSQTAIPSEFYLAPNYPNPFNPSTTIQYGLPSASTVELVIYNSLGQEVRTLFSGVQNAGQQRILWNGRNDNGAPVSSGIYIFRATIRSLEDGGTFRQSRKMMLIK